MSLRWFDPDETREVVDFFVDRFGLDPALFAGQALAQNGEYIQLATPEARAGAALLDYRDAGLAIARRTKSGQLKPVTRGMQALAKGATKNVVALDGVATLRDLVEGRAVSAPQALRGFVLLTLDGEVVGVALARDGRLHSQLPRAMTHPLDLRGF